MHPSRQHQAVVALAQAGDKFRMVKTIPICCSISGVAFSATQFRNTCGNWR
ncbi:MAG: hypothetical protein Q8L91_18225 [Polaromonas sp.]|nr:hypothetical protein [Polaromonas sp.]